MDSILMDTDFHSSDSSDEDDLDYFNVPIRRNERSLVPAYEEETFFAYFRVSRGIVKKITNSYRRTSYFNEIRHGGHGKLSALSQVLIFLWFVGHHTSSFRDISGRFKISLSTLHKVIHRVTLFLSNSSPDIIKWPTEQEKKISEAYFRTKGFPNVIGAIDGSHIKISKPLINSISYINRKGDYSIQMQTVCDHRHKIIDIFVGYPGSADDSLVFKNSPLFQNIQQKCGSYVLLGDGGYPLLKNLMTPFKDRGQLTSRQINFNMKLSQNRSVIEQCFEILKQKFRQLNHVKLRRIPLIVHFIRACCVLHNITLDDEFICSNEGLRLTDESTLTFDVDDEGAEDEMDALLAREAIVDLLAL